MDYEDKYPVKKGKYGPIYTVHRGITVYPSSKGTWEVSVSLNGERDRRRFGHNKEKAFKFAEKLHEEFFKNKRKNYGPDEGNSLIPFEMHPKFPYLERRILLYDGGYPPCVYFLVKGEAVVYIGKTVNIQARIEHHKKDENKDFDDVFFIPAKDEQEMDALERKLIRAFEPPLNKAIP